MIQYQENSIFQKLNNVEKDWAIPQLFETYKPLAGEPIGIRNDAMRRILPMAEERFDELSDAGRLCYHFWKQLQLHHITEQIFTYTTKVTNTYQWELKLNGDGLFYKDISGEYSHTGKIYEQLLSDFWFYGPLMPISELAIRQQVVAGIRNAFLQIGPVAYKHFELFEYPPTNDSLSWERGDRQVQDFVIVRDYGIDVGQTNWHDGLVFLEFISFERFLTGQGLDDEDFKPKVKAAIRKHLQTVLAPEKTFATPKEHNEDSKRIFMENGGMHHYIMRDYADIYKPGPGDEDRWRKQLVKDYALRLKSEDRRELLQHLATALRYNGVTNVEQQLVEAAKGPNLKARQAIAQLLHEDFHSEKSVGIMLSMLAFENEESYWRNYVFNSLGRMREYISVRNFILQCLRGNNEIHFKKAVDVLGMWGMLGDKALMDRQLLLGLNWDDACAADPNFQESLNKVSAIIMNDK